MDMQELKTIISREAVSGLRVISEDEGPMSSGSIELESTAIAIRFVLERGQPFVEIANRTKESGWHEIVTVMNQLRRENDLKDHGFAEQFEYLNHSMAEIEMAAGTDGDEFFKKLSDLRTERAKHRIESNGF